MRSSLALILWVAFSTAAAAQQVPGFDTFLVPIATDAMRGAYGSLWRTELRILHESDGSAVIGLNDSATCRTAPDEFVQCTLPPLTLPGTVYSRSFLESVSDAWPGALVYVPERAAAGTHFSLVVRDAANVSPAAAITVPVLSTRTLTAATQYFLGLRTDPGVRWTLRIYEPHTGASSTFRVVIRDEASRQVLREMFVSTGIAQQCLSERRLRSFAGDLGGTA